MAAFKGCTNGGTEFCLDACFGHRHGESEQVFSDGIKGKEGHETHDGELTSREQMRHEM